MRHLKRIFESSEDDMIVDLNDIVLDIKDLGFFTDVRAGDYIITVTISRLRSSEGFVKNDNELSELIEVITRIRDYAKLNDYLIDTTWLARLCNMNKKEFNQVIADNRFTMYITMYPKSR